MNDPVILPPEPITNKAIAKRLYEEAKRKLQSGEIRKPKLVWLELNGCSGNILSLLDGDKLNIFMCTYRRLASRFGKLCYKYESALEATSWQSKSISPEIT